MESTSERHRCIDDASYRPQRTRRVTHSLPSFSGRDSTFGCGKDPLPVVKIVIVAGDYPFIGRSHAGTFVHATARSLGGHGARIAVISPRPVGRTMLRDLSVFVQPEELEQAAIEEVRRPWYPSFSNLRLGRLSTLRMTGWSFSRAVSRAGSHVPFRPDVAYAHFLFPAGAAVLRLARSWDVPAVVALGESSMRYYEEHLGWKRTRGLLGGFDRLLSVSEENRRYCVENLGLDGERIDVIPNAADPAVFHPRDRREAKRSLGLPVDEFLVLFVGHFEERKGPTRVLRAIEGLPRTRGVFLGRGPQRIAGPRVAFAGVVDHHEVARWMAASDVFVLPTLAEGSPNAIAEAMASGLPIVSSDIPSVREIVCEDAAILVDPTSVDAIRDALETVQNNENRRREMEEAALRSTHEYSLEDRGDRILRLLEAVVHGAGSRGGV